MQFENRRYFVRTKDDLSGYEVINKETGVVEYDAPSLPRSIVAAEEYDNFFTYREHKRTDIKEVKGEVVTLLSRQDSPE